MSQLYPAFLDIAGRKVVVVGGGPVAQRKVGSLLERGGRVVLISPTLTDKLAELSEQKSIEVKRRCYRGGDLAKAWLVIAATEDRQVNEVVYAEANQRGIFCNVVDEPSLCTFQVPSVVQRGDLQIAISTGGVSPALAKYLRVQLQSEFGEYYAAFLRALGQLRRHLKEKFPDDQPRRAEILEAFINSPALEVLRQGRLDEFQRLFEDWKNR